MSNILHPEYKVLLPKQMEFLRAGRDKKVKIAVGSTRCGKSVALAVEAVEMALFSPPGALLFIGKTLANVHSNICDVITDIFGPGYIQYLSSKRSSKTKEVSLLGRLVHCKGADDVGEAQRIKGMTVSGIVCDEVTTYPEEVFAMTLTRLDKIGARLVGSTNPEGLGHWLKVKYLDAKDSMIYSMNFTLDDNPLADPEYKEFLKNTLRGAYLQRYYYGKWASAEGVIYSDFCEKHIGDYSYLPSSEYICGVDFGMSHKTEAVLVGFSHLEKPKIWVAKEFCAYQSPDDIQSISAIADGLVEWMAPIYPSTVYVDPAALVLKNELRRRLPSSVAVLGAKNDVLNGIHFVSRLLYNYELGIDFSCKQLITELYSYSWDATKSAQNGKDEVKKTNDDGVDALRYALYSHFGNQLDPVQEARRVGDESIRRNARLPSYKKILGGYGENNSMPFRRGYF